MVSDRDQMLREWLEEYKVTEDDVKAVHPDFPVPGATVNLLHIQHTARVRDHFHADGMQTSEYGVLVTSASGQTYQDSTHATWQKAGSTASALRASHHDTHRVEVVERSVTTHLGEWRHYQGDIDDWACQQYGYHQAATRHTRDECSVEKTQQDAPGMYDERDYGIGLHIGEE